MTETSKPSVPTTTPARQPPSEQPRPEQPKPRPAPFDRFEIDDRHHDLAKLDAMFTEATALNRCICLNGRQLVDWCFDGVRMLVDVGYVPMGVTAATKLRRPIEDALERMKRDG